MHQKGFVHSDIKPQNVLLTPEGRVKIIDFGQTCTINTIKKRIQGTPDFMAPEQTRAEKITVRTDVFCLGSTMYSILTGEPLPTGTGAHFARMGTRRRSGLPAPHELNPHLPVSLSRLVLDSVQDDPEKRPESMRAVSKRLKLVCHMLTQALNGPT
jgi:serine/threonine-protein kinase